MQSRYRHGKGRTNKLIAELINDHVIEDVKTHGASGLRLIKPAVREAKVVEAATEQTTEKQETSKEVQPAKFLVDADAKYGNLFSPLACRVMAMFWACMELDQAPLAELFRFCLQHGLKQKEIRRAIGELHSLEYVFVDHCSNSQAYFLTICNLDTPTRSGVDMLVEFDEVREEVATA